MLDQFVELLLKTGAMTDEDAELALRRYQSLKENKPGAAQIGRYAALGAVASPVSTMIENKIRGEPHLFTAARPGAGGMARAIGGRAVAGAVGMGLVPIARHWLDRSAEKGKLKQYLDERGYVQGGHVVQPGENT